MNIKLGNLYVNFKDIFYNNLKKKKDNSRESSFFFQNKKRVCKKHFSIKMLYITNFIFYVV